MTYLLSLGVSCVCFQRVATKVYVFFTLSQYESLCVCGGGCERDNGTLCKCKYSVRGQISRKIMNVYLLHFNYI